MEHIIVTVLDQEKDIEMDMELPFRSEVGSFLQDMKRALYADSLPERIEGKTLMLTDVRLRKELSEDKTLEEQKVWNGDYLEVRLT